MAAALKRDCTAADRGPAKAGPLSASGMATRDWAELPVRLVLQDQHIAGNGLILDPGKPVGLKQTLEVRRFEVVCDAASFAAALAPVLAQPGLHIGGDFEVLRARGVTGAFTLGEQFQGRFAIDDRLGQDGPAHPYVSAGTLGGDLAHAEALLGPPP